MGAWSGEEIPQQRFCVEISASRSVRVVFADKKVQRAYYKLRKENPLLYKFLERATDDIKADPVCGIAIPKRLIPKVYRQRYGINNLWKYNLPDAWRLVYSLVGDEIEIIAILLELFPHKEYERRFRY